MVHLIQTGEYDALEHLLILYNPEITFQDDELIHSICDSTHPRATAIMKLILFRLLQPILITGGVWRFGLTLCKRAMRSPNPEMIFILLDYTSYPGFVLDIEDIEYFLKHRSRVDIKRHLSYKWIYERLDVVAFMDLFVEFGDLDLFDAALVNVDERLEINDIYRIINLIIIGQGQDDMIERLFDTRIARRTTFYFKKPTPGSIPRFSARICRFFLCHPKVRFTLEHYKEFQGVIRNYMFSVGIIYGLNLYNRTGLGLDIMKHIAGYLNYKTSWLDFMRLSSFVDELRNQRKERAMAIKLKG